jgi:hypothetical protein
MGPKVSTDKLYFFIVAILAAIMCCTYLAGLPDAQKDGCGLGIDQYPSLFLQHSPARKDTTPE